MIERRTRLSAGLLLIAAAISIGVLVTFVGEPRADLRIVQAASEWRDGSVGRVMGLASDYGYGRWLVPASLALALVSWALARRPGDVLAVALSTGVAVVVTRVLKEGFARARPDDAHFVAAGFSMPSGHATSAAAFATSLVLVLPRTRTGTIVGVLVACFALVVGASRVVFGVHYPSDVVAGFCSGTGIALVVSALVDFLVPRRAANANG